MWVSKNEVKELSENIRKIIDGQNIDIRENNEGIWNILKNDIHTLASLKNEQVYALQNERDLMKNTIANISHQLKTPITPMMIMADLLENAPPDKQAEFLSNVKTGLVRMEWLISTLLKMAKLDAGVVDFAKDSIAANALAEAALQPLQILLELKNQTIEIIGETDIVCDKHWTGEALTNLIKNAMEHSPEGGRIVIESGENPICKWISVTDSGDGIVKTKISSLFRRFEGSENGYGIGLPLALAIMQGQGGDIEVDGGSGVGAVFTLKFYV